MRIKFLKPVPAADGTTHEPGTFLNVENDVLAKRYVDLGYAEEAPEAPDFAAQVKGIMAEGFAALNESLKAVSASKGPATGRIEAGESELDRKKSLGHQLQLIGVVSNQETDPRVAQEAAATLKNLYGSTYRTWTDADNRAPVTAGKAVTQNEGSGPAGGWGVQPEYSQTLYKIAIEDTVFASRAKRMPMASNSFIYPKLDQTTAPAAGQTAYTGGLIMYWQGEQAGLSKTNAQLKQGELKAGKLQGYTQISMELIQDNVIGLESLVTDLIRDAVSYYVDLATLVGDGVDKPLGLTNAPSLLSFDRAGGAGTQTLAFSDLTGLKRRILPQYRKGAFYIVTMDAEDALWTLKDTGNRPLFLSNATGSMAGAIGADVGAGNQLLLGLPYVVTEKTPAFGTKGDVMCVAPQGYMLGERMGLEIAASNAPGFLNGLMTYRVVARVAGQPILDKPFTTLSGVQASTFAAIN